MQQDWPMLGRDVSVKESQLSLKRGMFWRGQRLEVENSRSDRDLQVSLTRGL